MLDAMDLKRTGIELRHFRYFVAVAEELHFGRASERLNIVQPALTAQIKSLERMLGIDLLDRSKRRVELTEAGRELLRESYVALAQVGSAIATVKDFARGATGTLRLGYVANAAITGLIPSSIRRFRAQWPNVNVTLKEMPTSEVTVALLRNEIDLGYATMMGSEFKDISSRNVGTWPWQLVVANTHRLAGTGTASVADISDDTLAVYAEADARTNISGVLTALPSLSPERIYRSGDILSLMTYVSSGLGVAFAPTPMRSLNFPGLVFLEIRESIPDMQMNLLWRSEGMSAAVRNYLRCVDQPL